MNVLEYAIYVVTGVAAWFIKLLWNGQKETREQLENLRLDVASNYTRKDDFKEAIAEFKDSLRDSHTTLYEKINKIDDYLRDKK
jgi:hypothetical protein